MRITIGQNDQMVDLVSGLKMEGYVLSHKCVPVMRKGKAVPHEFKLLVEVDGHTIPRDKTEKAVKLYSKEAELIRFGCRFDARYYDNKLDYSVGRAELLADLFPGPQLLKVTVSPKWADEETTFKGVVKIKHKKRLSKKNRAAIVIQQFLGNTKLIVSDQVPKGQAWVSKRKWFNTYLPKLWAHMHDGGKSLKGCTAQALVVMLREKDEAKRAMFFDDIFESMQDWEAITAGERVSKRLVGSEEAWIERHIPKEGGSPVHKVACKLGKPGNSVVRHLINQRHKALLEGPIKDGCLGYGWEDYTVSVNDGLEDDEVAVTESSYPIAVNGTVSKDGNGYKMCFRMHEDIKDDNEIWISDDCLKVTGGMTEDFIAVLIGTTSSNIAEMNFNTANKYCGDMDTMDFDGDKVRIRKSIRRLPGQNDNKGKMFRSPFSKSRAMKAIKVLWSDGGISFPCPSANNEASLEKKEVDPMPLKFDFGKPRGEALLDLFRMINTAWNSAKVGTVNLTLQNGTLLWADENKAVKEFSEEDLNRLGDLQEDVIDLKPVAYDNLVWFLNKNKLITGDRTNGVKGVVPEIYGKRFPWSQVIVTNTAVDRLRIEHDKMVETLKLFFLEGTGSPMLDTEKTVVSDNMRLWVEFFMNSLEDHKEDMRDAMQDQDEENDYDAKEERSIFIKNHIRGFVLQVIGKDILDEKVVLTDEDKLKLDAAAYEVEKAVYEINRKPMQTWVVDGFSDNKTAKGKFDWAKTMDITYFRVIASFVLV